MRKTFDRELSELNADLISMAAAAEDALDLAISSLINKDADAARLVIEAKQAIIQAERVIERRCFKLLLSQQPVARDLRHISTALKMIYDLQRIGDQAADIAQMAIFLHTQVYITKLQLIPKMATVAGEMVKQSIFAYVHSDVEIARGVIARDDVVDDLFLQAKASLVDLIVKDRSNADQALDFMMIAKYIERIADHAVNIASWAIFCVTGEHDS